MNMLHVSFVPMSLIGVQGKIDGQLNGLRDVGFNVSYARVREDGYYFNSDKIFSISNAGTIFRKLSEPLIFHLLLKSLRLENYDVIYIRYMRMTPWFYAFLKVVRSLSRIVIMEVPAYPYDNVYSSFSLQTLSDKFYRRKLVNLVDYLTYNGAGDEKIFGVRSLRIFDGIDTSCVKMSRCGLVDDKKQLVLAGVGHVSEWHGYDRIIRSISALPNDCRDEFKFYIIGIGPFLEKLKSIVSDLSLQDSVIFLGEKYGKDLDQAMFEVDVAVGSLGLYRINIDEISPLKAGEYAARGLHMLLGYKDPRFMGCKFVLQVPNDESIIDLRQLYSWFMESNVSGLSIRNYAATNLSWYTFGSAILDIAQDSDPASS